MQESLITQGEISSVNGYKGKDLVPFSPQEPESCEEDTVRVTRHRIRKAVVVVEKSTVQVQSHQNGIDIVVFI